MRIAWTIKDFLEKENIDILSIIESTISETDTMLLIRSFTALQWYFLRVLLRAVDHQLSFKSSFLRAFSSISENEIEARMELPVYLLVISLVEGSMLLTAAFMFVFRDKTSMFIGHLLVQPIKLQHLVSIIRIYTIYSKMCVK